MKILYAKQGSDIKLLDGKKYQRGTRLRRGLLQSLRAAGHTVEFVSFTREAEWSREIDKNADALLIENGPTNPLFQHPLDGGHVQYRHRIKELLQEFPGKVFYYQQDGRLPLIGEHCHLRPFTVLTHAEDTEAFKKSYCHYRDNPLVSVRFMPLFFDDENYPERKPVESPEYDLAYCGREHDTNRTAKLKKFYSKGRVLFVGEWKHPPLEITPAENVFGKTMDVYSTAFAVVQIGDKNFEKYRMHTTRIIEAVQAGAVLLCDKDLRLSFFEPEEFVDDAEHVMQIVRKLRADPDMRRRMILSQRSRLRRWREAKWHELLA